MIVKFFQQSFTADTPQKAYDDANKWLAHNVIKKKDEIGDTLWSVERVKDADSPTFKIELYAGLDPEESTKEFCNKCQQFHSHFYINDQYNCNECKYTAFKKQMEQKLLIKKAYRKERLDQVLSVDEL